MIKVLHYSHNYEKTSPLVPFVSDYGNSNTDTTKWRPDISLARAYQGASSGKTLLYDFPDGKDSGEVVQTFIRSKGLDITEIESAEKRITQIIEDKKADDKLKSENSKEKKNFLDNIQKLADSASSESPESSQSPQSGK